MSPPSVGSDAIGRPVRAVNWANAEIYHAVHVDEHSSLAESWIWWYAIVSPGGCQHTCQPCMPAARERGLLAALPAASTSRAPFLLVVLPAESVHAHAS